MPSGRGRDPLALRHPGRTLAAGLVLIVSLGLLGSGVEARLNPTSLQVPGTASARGAKLLEERFGPSAPFAVLLRGPRGAVARQAPPLLRALRAEPGVSALSPRPGLILVDYHDSGAAAVRDAVPALEALLARRVHPPVRAVQSGYATLSKAIQDQSISATERAELIALPFLLLVLLAVFRSPIAALIPLGFGAAVVLCARGLLWVASHWLPIDAFSLTVATMMGLALGVDYSLLMVSRFREELAAGAPTAAAAAATRASAGRTTLFAGSTLFASMLVSVLILPGSLLLSLAGTAIAVTAVSVALANFLAPALLALLGGRIDRWRLGRARPSEHGLLRRTVAAALARPVPVALASGLGLLVLCAPALALRTGPPSARQLPPSDPARRDAELVSRQVGAGWEAPFVLVAASRSGPITSPADLRRLARFQRLLASQPGVQAAIGPRQIARRTAPLTRAGAALTGAEGESRLAGLRRLGPGLGRAADGVGKLRAGVSEASAGAGLLAQGSGRAASGAAELSAGLRRATRGGERAAGATERLAAGASRLAEGQHSAHAGALSLAVGLHDLLPELRKGSLAKARRLRAELRTGAAADPSLKPALARAESLVLSLAAARNEVRSLRSAAARLSGGSARLADGQDSLASGAARLARAAGSLGPGLHRLAGGAAALHDGIGQLRGGSEALSAGLSDGYLRSSPLQSRLHGAGARVSGQAASLARRRAELLGASPHLVDSGYFVLAALDGAGRDGRERAAQAIDLDAGGSAAAILVVSRYGLDTPGSEALFHRLGHLASGFEAKSGLRMGVAGGPAQLADYNHVTRARVPLVVLAMALVTFLALVAILRALPLAAIATAMNLLTVGVAFGVLVALFHVPAGWPLGGHDYVDAIGAAAIFGIVFGLSVDYAVFLLARVREEHERLGDHREALAVGLRRTAGVITGAAAIMIAVFACFAAAPIATVSQLGVALTVAVALDATVVRLLLLPALMLLAGERVWWLPAPLARLLPARPAPA